MFCERPCIDSLVAAIDKVVESISRLNPEADTYLAGYTNFASSNIPWLLGAIFRRYPTLDGLIAARQPSLSGKFGDEKTWLYVEGQLKEGNVLLSNLERDGYHDDFVRICRAVVENLRILPTKSNMRILIEYYNNQPSRSQANTAFIAQALSYSYFRFSSQSDKPLQIWGDAALDLIRYWKGQPRDEYFDITTYINLIKPEEYDVLIDNLCEFPLFRNFHCSKPVNEKFSKLILKNLESDPLKYHKLLNFVFALIAGGTVFKISRELYDRIFQALTGVENFWQASLLRLFFEDLSIAEATHVAADLHLHIEKLPIETRKNQFSLLGQLIKNLSLQNPIFHIFVASLAKTNCESLAFDARLVMAAYDAMGGALNKRNSDLCDDGIRNSLKLPLCVFS